MQHLAQRHRFRYLQDIYSVILLLVSTVFNAIGTVHSNQLF
jgi:hypothetical protein